MISTLESGAQLALHAMRRAALQDGKSCPIQTEKVISAQLRMRDLANMLLNDGRHLNLGEIGTLEASPDERSLLNVLSAAQHHDEEAFIAALRWLVGCEPNDNIRDTARKAAFSFSEAGWTWGAPNVPRAPEPPYGMKAVRPVE
jgi:hypothetical protein